MDTEKIVVKLHDVNYIPAYKEAEEIRQANESERQTGESIRELNEMTRENYYENFKRRVDNGEFNGGPANFLTIGSVEDGDEASATITGEAPQQVLNLVIPKGKDGIDGKDGEDGLQGDTLPIGAVIDYDGAEVPPNWEKVEENVVTLFDGNEREEITLLDNASNYSYFEIYYKKTDVQGYSFQKVVNPHGSHATLPLVHSNTDSIQLLQKLIYIQDKQIQHISSSYFNAWKDAGSAQAQIDVGNSNEIIITKVLGYK